MIEDNRIVEALKIKEGLDSKLVELYLTKDGGFIEAIKLLRIATGFSLKESKEYVEGLCKHRSFDINIQVPGDMYRDMFNQLKEKYGDDCSITNGYEFKD